MSSEHIGGWLYQEEDRQWLRAYQTDCLGEIGPLVSAPEEIDPRPYIRTENQGSMGSCAGHGMSTGGELCYHIATGETRQFSRMAAYIGGQRQSRITGDRGATIHGVVKFAMDVGLVPEEDWPYPGRYNPEPPLGWPETQKRAEPFRIRNHQVLDSYDAVFQWIASGLGGVVIGVRWGNVDRDGLIEGWPSGGGGHAVLLGGYSRREQSGRKYIWLNNSWGSSWGVNGWAEVAPKVVDRWFGDSFTVAIGVSDLSVPERRPVDWTVDNPF